MPEMSVLEVHSIFFGPFFFTNVCWVPVLLEFFVWCGCRWKAALFCVCACVWCGLKLRRTLPQLGTNDRIWFSEPICKQMKETKLVKIHTEIRALRPCQTSHRDFTLASDGQLMVTGFNSASFQQ